MNLSFFSGLVLLAAGLNSLADWPAWRGDGSGVAAEQDVPVQWSEGENLRWSTAVPGYGWSSPVIAGDRVFLTSAIAENQAPPQRKGPGGGEAAPQKVFRWEVHCLDRESGKILWTQVAAEHEPITGNHVSNTYASETPVTDGERVYAYFGMNGVFCYDLTGHLLWSRDLGAYRTFANWGSSSSPAFDGERLFVLCDNEERSFLVALDPKTGKDLWRIARRERSTWSTPILWRNSRRTELVCMGSDYIRAYDPQSGDELWRLASEKHLPVSANGSSRGKSASGGCKASPVASRDLLFVGMSSKAHGTQLGPMWAIRAGAAGDISLRDGERSSEDVAWFRAEAGPHFTSALVYEDRLYVFPPHDRGVLSCFDAKTGATIYAEPLPGAAGFKASPCVGSGRIYCPDENGTTFVIAAGDSFKLLAKNPLGEMTWASPAISKGDLFLRTTDHLFCLGPK